MKNSIRFHVQFVNTQPQPGDIAAHLPHHTWGRKRTIRYAELFFTVVLRMGFVRDFVLTNVLMYSITHFLYRVKATLFYNSVKASATN